MANENENVKVENQNVETTEEKKVEQVTDNTLVVPATTEEKKPSKVLTVAKVGGAILTGAGALVASFLIGKKFGNKS